MTIVSQGAALPHLAATDHRAQLLAEAITSAYIDEIARSARPRELAVSAPPPAHAQTADR
jgi:hypothetical protein